MIVEITVTILKWKPKNYQRDPLIKFSEKIEEDEKVQKCC